MKKILLGTTLVSLLLAGCSAQQDLTQMQQPQAISQENLSPVLTMNTVPGKSDYVYSVAIDTNSLDTFIAKAKEYLAKNVAANDIQKFEVSGWKDADDAQGMIKFWGVKNKPQFENKIVPALQTYLGSYGGDGVLDTLEE